MEITVENILPYSNKKISFSLFKRIFTLFFFKFTNAESTCKGIYFESKKNLSIQKDCFAINKHFFFLLKQNDKLRLGKITRRQLIQKIS